MKRDWKEQWIDEMGLIVALSGAQRFEMLCSFKSRMVVQLTPETRSELQEAIRLRFTPTNGQDGCQSGMSAVRESIK